jgi:hypothetical protein
MMRSLPLFVGKICWQNVIAGAVGLALGSLLGSLIILWDSRYAPVVVHEEQALSATAIRNGHIDLYFEVDRVRACPATTSRWLWTWTDHGGMKVKQFYPVSGWASGLSDIGRDQRFILSVPIPAGIPAGQWFYWARTVEHCPWLPNLFRLPVRESTDIPIRIIDEAP